MMVVVWMLAMIGLAVVLFIGHGMTQELIRALRQGHRIATAHARHSEPNPSRKPSLSLWWVCFKHDLMNNYSETIVGPYALPYDPKKPARPYY
jgi:hypothetical protein